MAKAYWIGHMTITDEAAYGRYIAANAEPFAKFGAKFIVRCREIDQVEGTNQNRTVVIEFPNLQAATACYASPEYQAAIALRDGASIGDLQIVDGYDGPQPGDMPSN